MRTAATLATVLLLLSICVGPIAGASLNVTGVRFSSDPNGEFPTLGLHSWGQGGVFAKLQVRTGTVLRCTSPPPQSLKLSASLNMTAWANIFYPQAAPVAGEWDPQAGDMSCQLWELARDSDSSDRLIGEATLPADAFKDTTSTQLQFLSRATNLPVARLAIECLNCNTPPPSLPGPPSTSPTLVITPPASSTPTSPVASPPPPAPLVQAFDDTLPNTVPGSPTPNNEAEAHESSPLAPSVTSPSDGSPTKASGEVRTEEESYIPSPAPATPAVEESSPPPFEPRVQNFSGPPDHAHMEGAPELSPSPPAFSPPAPLPLEESESPAQLPLGPEPISQLEDSPFSPPPEATSLPSPPPEPAGSPPLPPPEVFTLPVAMPPPPTAPTASPPSPPITQLPPPDLSQSIPSPTPSPPLPASPELVSPSLEAPPPPPDNGLPPGWRMGPIIPKSPSLPIILGIIGGGVGLVLIIALLICCKKGMCSPHGRPVKKPGKEAPQLEGIAIEAEARGGPTAPPAVETSASG